MAKTYNLQSSFNKGVLDKSMRARMDTEQYFQGVEQADNFKFIPQGGARRREGTEYIATLTAESRIVPLVMSNTQRYILAFSNNQLKVFRADTDALVDTVTTTYTTAQLFEMDFAQSGDDLLIVHEDHIPRIVARGASDSAFTITDVTFIGQPTFDFNDTDSPTATSEIQEVTFTFAEGVAYKLNLEGIDTETMIFADIAEHASQIQQELHALFNTSDTGITVARTDTKEFTVTFAGSSAKNWRLIQGRATDGSSGSVSSAQTQQGVGRTEDVWSSTRGYPKTCTFHEGRLWFGGSRALPNTVFGSYVNSFFNFDFGRGRDDQTIMYQLQSDQNNKIQAIYSSQTLQIFTSGGEYVVYQSEFDPITPANIRIISNTKYGAAAVKPTDIEGSVTYVQRTGKAIREMVAEQGRNFTSPSISYLAPNIVVSPVELESVRGTASDDANYILAVNSDGDLALFNTLKEQNVAAWSLWKTDGDFTSVAVAFDDIYVAVKRVINSSTVYYLEKFNTDYNMDSTIKKTSVGSATVTGLAHLEGETVKVKADGAVLQDRTVSSGQIVCERTVTNVEIGMPYTATLKTMPVIQQTGAGTNLSQELRISKCTLELVDSLGLIVNGTRIPDRKIGDPVGTPTTPFTGRKETPILGWAKTQQITITHTDPVNMTLLGLQLEVNS